MERVLAPWICLLIEARSGMRRCRIFSGALKRIEMMLDRAQIRDKERGKTEELARREHWDGQQNSDSPFFSFVV
jgi:hypothetical protein